MSAITKYNGVSAYSVKSNGIADTRKVNGIYTPNPFDTTDIKLYFDPANPNFISGTSYTNSLGINVTGDFFGGMEGGITQNGWIDVDGVNDYASIPQFQIGTTFTSLSWSYAERGSNVNQYVISLTNGALNGFRLDIGNGATMQWTRGVIYSGGGTTSMITNSQPIGNWYLQYIAVTSGTSLRYGCSKPDETFDHTTHTPVTLVAGNTNAGFGRWGNASHPNYYQQGKVGEFWQFDRELSNSEIERIYENTKARYGY